MASKRVYDQEESKRTEQAYLTPEIEHQRKCTLEEIDPQRGETIVDIGCGPGLLARELAAAVADAGSVIGVDSSEAMLELARDRCAELPNVDFIECDATDLQLDDASADVITCVQVLLYVADVEKAIREMHRVLRPGGRITIMETDWRSTVLHSLDEALTEKIIEAWDRAVPSPRLPARLGPLLRQAGFTSVRTTPVPVLSSDSTPEGFSMAMMAQSAEAAVEQGTITESQSQGWLGKLAQLGADGRYFFCVNRFLFSALKK